MTTDLKGRIALVTGASRGIGSAVAVALAEAGAAVAVNFHVREKEAYETCSRIKALGRRCLPVRADVSKEQDVAALLAVVAKELGAPTIIVNNAGIARPVTVDTVTLESWDEVLVTNLTAAFLVTQAALPAMREKRWGRIINISSVAAQIGGVVGPQYAASKAGMIGLTHYYASHLANEGITVNAVAPGPIKTDMAANLPLLTGVAIPVGRFGEPDEVAAAVVMLAHNGYITGQTINVNGGRYMS